MLAAKTKAGSDVFDGAIDLTCDNDTINRMDKIIAKMITLGDKTRRFPVNEAQLRQYCNEGLRYMGIFKGTQILNIYMQ